LKFLDKRSLISSLYNSRKLALTRNYTPGVPLICLKIWSNDLGIIPLELGGSSLPSMVCVLPVPVYP
jgi:hypothetical protein